MKLLVGLGNPGAKYERNRHNIGFMALDRIRQEHGLGPWRRRFQGETSDGTLAGEKVVLLKPATYMNESGRSVGEAARFLKIKTADIVVFHDELDLAPGKLRIKTGGGNAGHNGLRSITAHLDNEYVRVRLGIGHPGHKDAVAGYVLHDFAKSDADWLEPLLDAMARHAGFIANGEYERFQTAVAQGIGPSKGEAAPAVKPGRKPADGGGDDAKPKRPSQRDLARKAAEMASSAAQRPAGRHPTGERAAKQQTAMADRLKAWLRGKGDDEADRD